MNFRREREISIRKLLFHFLLGAIMFWFTEFYHIFFLVNVAVAAAAAVALTLGEMKRVTEMEIITMRLLSVTATMQHCTKNHENKIMIDLLQNFSINLLFYFILY